MGTAVEEMEILRVLRAKQQAEGGVFWADSGELAVFDPDTAQHINALNFSDLTLPDRLIDLLRRRKSAPVSWKQVRAAWIGQLHRLSDAEGIAQLAGRMAALLEERLNRPLDLVWAIQEISTQALVPLVVAGLSAGDLAHILRDQDYKLARLLTTESLHEPFRKALRAAWIQIQAGMVVRRELGGRARGRRPRQCDLTDPIVDMLPVLGMDRAVDAVTTVLTAIAGPPGAAAVCLVYELARQSEWLERLTSELEQISPEQLYATPTRAAPRTHRFVKETLRMWSPPLLLTRSVRSPMQLDQAELSIGQHYFVSTYLIHHDQQCWADPDNFDPDRWLPGAQHGPCSSNSYVPFGWAPTACIGASLGTIQLMILCYLLCTRYRVELTAPETVHMALAAVPVPRNFHGTIARR